MSSPTSQLDNVADRFKIGTKVFVPVKYPNGVVERIYFIVQPCTKCNANKDMSVGRETGKCAECFDTGVSFLLHTQW